MIFKKGMKVVDNNGLEGVVKIIGGDCEFPVYAQFVNDTCRAFAADGRFLPGRVSLCDIKPLPEKKEPSLLETVIAEYKARQAVYKEGTLASELLKQDAFRAAAEELAGKLLYAVLRGECVYKRQRQSQALFDAAFILLYRRGVACTGRSNARFLC